MDPGPPSTIGGADPTEDETTLILDGEAREVLREEGVAGWLGPWNNNDTNPFLRDVWATLSDLLAAGDKLWNNCLNNNLLLNTPLNLSPSSKLKETCGIIVETSVPNIEPSQYTTY